MVKFLKWLLSMWYTFCGGVKGYCCGAVVACKVQIVKFLKCLLSMWCTFCGGVKGYCCCSVVVQLLLVKF